MNLFINTLFDAPTFFAIYITIVIFSVCVHEYSHARVALWQGDDTAASLGHLTLNPMRQMGGFSLILLALIGIAWGAVPVNKSKFKHNYSDALVSFAGPCANLILCIIFALTSQIIEITITSVNTSQLIHYLQLGSFLNMILFLLNMIPCYPFDGWFVLTHFLPLKKIKGELLNAISLCVVLIVFSFFDYLFWVAEYICGILFGIIYYLLVTFPTTL